MSRRLFIAVPLTVIAIAAFIQMTVFYKNSGLPFNVITRGTSRVITQMQGVPLPPGLKTGDELELRQLTPAERAALLPNMNFKSGLRYTFIVRRGSQTLSVPVTTQEFPVTAGQRLDNVLGDLLFFALLVLGLLAIWRGHNLAAWGLGVFALVIIVQVSVRNLPLADLWIVWAAILSNVIVFPVMFIGLFLMAYALSTESLSRRIKRIFSGVFALLYLLFTAISFIGTVGFVFFNLSPTFESLGPAVSIVALVGLGLISFVLLVMGYRHSGAEQRLRIRWILYSTGLMLLVVVVTVFAFFSTELAYQLALANISDFIFLLAVIGYTYAVLRQRLVDLRIVINRTLVYSVIVATVVGIFAAISTVLEHFALGQNASLLLELIIPLALGIAIHTLRKQVEAWINRFIFRRKYQAEAALNDFARTCGFIEEPQELLTQTVDNVLQHSGAETVALYERGIRGYMRRLQRGKFECPMQVEVDHPALVRLRAGDHDVDLHILPGSLGDAGYLFPLMARGTLLGAVVCGSRPAEQYSSDERKLLQHLTRQVAAAWQTLKMRDKENLVDALANGTLDPSAAREQARRLLFSAQAA